MPPRSRIEPGSLEPPFSCPPRGGGPEEDGRNIYENLVGRSSEAEAWRTIKMVADGDAVSWHGLCMICGVDERKSATDVIEACQAFVREHDGRSR